MDELIELLADLVIEELQNDNYHCGPTLLNVGPFHSNHS